MISAEAFLQRNPVALEERCRAEQGERNVDAESSHRFARRGMGAVADDSNDADACREAALRLLDAAPRSSGALRERLLGKGYDEEIVNEVIERLIRVQLIDDRAYAESAVRYCAGRMMGRRGAVMELARKGVDRSRSPARGSPMRATSLVRVERRFVSSSRTTRPSPKRLKTRSRQNLV